MPSISKTALPALVLLAMVQYCPAPFLAAIPPAVAVGLGAVSAVVGAAASVAGVVTSALTKRDEFASELTSEFNSRIKRQDFGTGTAWQDCHGQLTGANIVFSGPSPGTILVQGVPSACMTLSTIITGNFNAGNPVPQGSDSISFTNLSNEEILAIQSALDGR